jgi:2-oxoglutarate ferredoxin oxidoreductase subunit delta
MEAVTILPAWCKGCGICVAFCPKQALALEKGKTRVDSARCIACGMCELYCPDLAITVDKSLKKKNGEGEGRS